LAPKDQMNNFRLMKERPFVEKMNQEMAGGLFYFDTDDDPEKFLGVNARYPYKDGENVIDGGQSSGASTTSIWAFCWSPNTTYGIFPQRSQAGIRHRDVGKGEAILVEDGITTGSKYYAYQTHFKWDLGLVVEDWRYIARYCNIATSGTGSNIFNPDKMIELYNEIPEWSMGNGAMYMNKTIMTQIHKDAFKDSNRMYQTIGPDKGTSNAYGGPVVDFWGVKLRKCDQILNTETPLSAE
jgi:hypothetical protein